MKAPSNCYGVSTEIHRVTNTPDLASRAAAYGVEYAVVDGTNPTEVYEAMQVAMEHARSGKGPYLVEAKVYRYQGHYCGDPAVYRPKEYMEEALKKDGIMLLGERLMKLGATQEELDAVKAEAEAEMDEAVKFADESPYPDPATVLEALHEEMLRDDKMFIMGEDMAVMGNVFAITRGFLDEFGPNRVIDTPISEEGFVGMAVGAAMRGMHPVVELMYDDFATECADPLFNQAAKIRYMTGGQCSVPMVLRAPMGAGRRNAGQHSQSLENFFCHFPGLKVVAPCSAEDAKGLLKTAIRDEDPVIFLEHKLLYAHKEEIPEGEYTIPLGQAKVKREGKDLTIISWSREVNFALEAAKTLEQEGIDVEVLDLRSLVPLDWDAIKASISKTHNAIIVSEEVKRGSFAGELSAEISEELFDELDAPVERVCGLNICSPFSPVLEDENFPHPADIVAAVKRVLNK